MQCERCKRQIDEPLKTSIFTDQNVCEACIQKERNHPQFEKARDTVQDEMNKGNYKFKGIGLPEDLS